MEALILSLGLVPFLAGRTVFALGLLVAWFGLERVRADFPWLQVPFLLVSAAVALLGDALVRAAGRAVYRAAEEVGAAMRRLLDLAQVALVVLMSVAMAFELLRRTARAAVDAVSVQDGLPVQLAGVSKDGAILLTVGLSAWVFASLRVRLRTAFSQVPFSDSARLGWSVYLTDAAWTLLGLPLVLAFPMVGAVLAAVSLAGLAGLWLLLRRITRGAVVPCAACGKALHPGASQCPHCRVSRQPSRLGGLGRVLPGVPEDVAAHRLQLLTLRRCPTCAQRIPGDGRAPCESCGLLPFSSADEARAFARHVDKRVAALMPVFGGLALIPGMGLVLGLLLYTLAPSGALRGYVRWRHAMGTRVLRTAALLALAALQPIPLVGALAGMGLIAVMQVWTRQAFLSGAVPEVVPG